MRSVHFASAKHKKSAYYFKSNIMTTVISISVSNWRATLTPQLLN